MNRLFFLLLFLVFSLPASSEELKFNIYRQTSSEVKVPKTGLSKTSVNQSFGEPETKTQAIGNPPISRWVYRSFTVYFEYDKVVHTVIHHEQG